VIIFPLVATGVSTVFALMLLRQYARKRRVQQLAWGVALAMYAVASLTVTFGTTQGWDPTLYRIFYLFGAMLNVPWLALGSVALLQRRELTGAAVLAVAVVTAFGVIKVLSSHPCEAVVGPSGHQSCVASNAVLGGAIFGGKDIPSGSDVWRQDHSVRALAIYYSTIAYVIVVGIAALTSRPRKGVSPPQQRVKANLLISIGVTVVAIGSTALVKYARGSAFSVALATGVAVMFVGFLLAMRTPRAPTAEPGPTPG
jgi:hypothetical protein